MLYKYLQPCRIPILEEQLIRFTQPGALNDPFEMRPAVVGYDTPDVVTAQLEGIKPTVFRSTYDARPAEYKRRVTFEEFCREANEMWPRIQDAVGVESDVVALSFWDRALTQLDEKVGVLCLSEPRDSLLMWSHYAAEHRGFVIGFNPAHPFFNQTPVPEVPQFGRLLSIRYAADRPICNLMDLQDFSLLLVKSQDWAYEQEYRMFLPLDMASTTQEANRYPIALFSLPAGVISEVVIGARMDANDKARIMDAVDNIRAHGDVRLFQARPNPMRFELDVTEEAI